jgi:1,4-alpha-glucan branching enzyme
MTATATIFDRKQTHFVLWRPNTSTTPPVLVIGQLKPGNPPTLIGKKEYPLAAVPDAPGLWEVAAADCELQAGQVYHYWFDVEDTSSSAVPMPHIRCTDPLAFAVDWRLFPPDTTDSKQPAAVIKFDNGKLLACDPGGEVGRFDNEVPLNELPPNNRLVIYELPTAWTLNRTLNQPERAVGTFQDVRALLDETVGGANFAELTLLDKGQSYLTTLGVNAVELLPPADSFFKREWGYDTAHFLAPDHELGFPEGNASPTPLGDLTALVQACHRHGIRLFVDVVMAFGREEAYQRIDRPDFCIDDPQHHQDDPDAKTSGRGQDGHQEVRNGFGSTLFRYTKAVDHPTYDPVSGAVASGVVPARQLMFTYLTRWMQDFHIDGIRMDSVENVANWDFVGGFKDLARQLFRRRWDEQGLGDGADERFLVVGEELSLPPGLLRQQRLDGLWNDSFRDRIRAAILGELSDGGPVRGAINCLGDVFTDGAQVINYLTSHDVEGWRKERLFTLLRPFGLQDKEKRITLAFACLLTAVGIPMILAGEEFADQHDFFDEDGHVSQRGGKQIDPVDFGRLTGPVDEADEQAKLLLQMRQRIVGYVGRLIRLRTEHPALAVNHTDFLHEDFRDAKRVVVWKRGGAGQDPIVVVANFSDYQTPNALTDPAAEYRVPNWPATPPGRQWREVTQGRPVPAASVGREPIFSWEAKVYTLDGP